MGNFNRDRDYNRQGGGSGDFSRRSVFDRPQMHKATCANCGNECEVPFRPTGSKPIFCNNCFDRNSSQGGGERRSFAGRDSRVRTSFNDRPMYDAICTNCGNSCKIPFEPKEGREILCSSCFEQKNGAAPRQSSRMGDRPTQSSNTNQIDMLNAKLDKIMAHLGIVDAPKVELKSKPAKSEKTEKVKEVEAPAVENAQETASEVKVMDEEEPGEQEGSITEIIGEVLEEVKEEKKASRKRTTKKKE